MSEMMVYRIQFTKRNDPLNIQILGKILKIITFNPDNDKLIDRRPA
jgi:hypothetical protein